VSAMLSKKLALAAPGCPKHPTRRAGFSLLELLLVVVIILTLGALLLPAIGRARDAASSSVCLSRLRSLTEGFALYTVQNTGHFPDPTANNVSWEQAISPNLGNPSGASCFRCPADQEVYPMANSSYDWRDTGDVSTTLAGRSISTVTRTDVVLVFDALPGWHAQRSINVGWLNGSASSIVQSQWFSNLNAPVGGH
jgi:prepilin-type N-terminal cleavage/methylation domain-containing protein